MSFRSHLPKSALIWLSILLTSLSQNAPAQVLCRGYFTAKNTSSHAIANPALEHIGIGVLAVGKDGLSYLAVSPYAGASHRTLVTQILRHVHSPQIRWMGELRYTIKDGQPSILEANETSKTYLELLENPVKQGNRRIRVHNSVDAIPQSMRAPTFQGWAFGQSHDRVVKELLPFKQDVRHGIGNAVQSLNSLVQLILYFPMSDAHLAELNEFRRKRAEDFKIVRWLLQHLMDDGRLQPGEVNSVLRALDAAMGEDPRAVAALRDLRASIWDNEIQNLSRLLNPSAEEAIYTIYKMDRAPASLSTNTDKANLCRLKPAYSQQRENMLEVMLKANLEYPQVIDMTSLRMVIAYVQAPYPFGTIKSTRKQIDFVLERANRAHRAYGIREIEAIMTDYEPDGKNLSALAIKNLARKRIAELQGSIQNRFVTIFETLIYRLSVRNYEMPWPPPYDEIFLQNRYPRILSEVQRFTKVMNAFFMSEQFHKMAHHQREAMRQLAQNAKERGMLTLQHAANNRTMENWKEFWLALSEHFQTHAPDLLPILKQIPVRLTDVSDKTPSESNP